MRRLTPFLLLAGASVPVVVLGADGARADVPVRTPVQTACATPTLSVQPDSATAGGSVVVVGKGFANCADTVVCVVGQPCPPQPAPQPMSSIALQFTQGTLANTAATVNAGADGAFRTSVRIPAAARAGTAAIAVANGPSAVVTVVAAASKTRGAILPATGRNTYDTAGFGVALMAAGWALNAAGYRRRPRTS